MSTIISNSCRSCRRVSTAWLHSMRVGLASLLMVAGLGFPAVEVQAATGDLLATVNLPVPSPFGVAISGTFDGTNYMYTNFCANFPNCAPNDVIIVTPPPGDGAAVLVTTKPFIDGATGAPLFMSAISWDASRGLLWGATATGTPIEVWLFDISGVNAVGTFQFNNTEGGIEQVDGLAWDSNDDTLYLSPDVDCNVYQYSLGTGANPPMGTLMNTVAPKNAGGAEDCQVSGVAIGANNTLYIGRNGINVIRRVDKTTGAFVSTFSTTLGRVEDLVCDPVTYAPLEAILSKDSNGDLYEAFEVEVGTCPLVGGLDADIDIKFCSNPNGFNCKGGGVMPMTVFGSDTLDVTAIDPGTIMLCLATYADESECINVSSLKDANLEDRGDPTTDIGAAQCAINQETQEQERFLNPDGILDLELAWEKRDVVDVLFDGCSGFDKKEASPTLVFIAETFGGVEVRSTPVDSPGVDQVWRQK